MMNSEGPGTSISSIAQFAVVTLVGNICTMFELPMSLPIAMIPGPVRSNVLWVCSVRIPFSLLISSMTSLRTLMPEVGDLFKLLWGEIEVLDALQKRVVRAESTPWKFRQCPNTIVCETSIATLSISQGPEDGTKGCLESQNKGAYDGLHSWLWNIALCKDNGMAELVTIPQDSRHSCRHTVTDAVVVETASKTGDR